MARKNQAAKKKNSILKQGKSGNTKGGSKSNGNSVLPGNPFGPR